VPSECVDVSWVESGVTPSPSSFAEQSDYGSQYSESFGVAVLSVGAKLAHQSRDRDRLNDDTDLFVFGPIRIRSATGRAGTIVGKS
jgi:hypothetical protein